MSQSPDEDSLSSDLEDAEQIHLRRVVGSQSPDEDSLSSDLEYHPRGDKEELYNGLNPLTRIHCLPTLQPSVVKVQDEDGRSQSPDEDSLSSDLCRWADGVGGWSCGLNPLTRIHCLPTLNGADLCHADMEENVSIP